MVFEYKIIPIRNEALDATHEVRGFPERKKTVTRKLRRDRRKSKRDRRKSVRDGVIVNLSLKGNRRKGGDRRRRSAAYKSVDRSADSPGKGVIA